MLNTKACDETRKAPDELVNRQRWMSLGVLVLAPLLVVESGCASGLGLGDGASGIAAGQSDEDDDEHEDDDERDDDDDEREDDNEAGSPTPEATATPEGSEVLEVDQQQSVIDTSAGGLAIGGSSAQRLSQVVTAAVSGDLAEIRIPIACSSGNLIVEIQGVTGAAPDIVPDGVVVTSATVPWDSLPGFPTLDANRITLDPPVAQSAGQRYAIVLKSTGACGLLQGPVGNAYAGGNAYFIALPNPPDSWVTISIGTGRFDLPFQTLVK